MRADGARLMTCKERGERSGAREANVSAAAFRGNEGSGYGVQEAPRSCLLRRLVTPLHVARRRSQLTEHRTPIMETGDAAFRMQARFFNSRDAGTDFKLKKQNKKATMTKILV